MSETYASTETYSVADIEIVMRRVCADLLMIAGSTKAVTEEKARNWAHDIEVLAKNGYLRMVDLTLLYAGVEIRATRFVVNTDSGDLSSSRPGGVLWPEIPGAELRIVLSYTDAYDAAAREKTKSRLRIGWVASNADTSHAGLTSGTGRDYMSNGYGMQRKDFN
ncbi:MULTISPECIES: HORMA-1 domain-containing protein [Burkholderia cepacia complex]|uniref:HORMA-1 domain-containing protein n=1 Tax=Burkholderia cepacia complex TaxID=87882 RepID=UPI000F59F327|nr:MULTISPECIES: hypothetical protein [Burkholderia cepacia complex]MBU9478029.1 hypothetical protein [Burkholderia multivorans]RQT41396.1 hypothetical protein DF050_38360 [Burkholderia cepacia]